MQLLLFKKAGNPVGLQRIKRHFLTKLFNSNIYLVFHDVGFEQVHLLLKLQEPVM